MSEESEDVSEESKVRLATIAAPYGREVRLEEVIFESGMRLMRVTIREGRRFTIMDIDTPTASMWGKIMSDWAERALPG